MEARAREVAAPGAPVPGATALLGPGAMALLEVVPAVLAEVGGPRFRRSALAGR